MFQSHWKILTDNQVTLNKTREALSVLTQGGASLFFYGLLFTESIRKIEEVLTDLSPLERVFNPFFNRQLGPPAQ